MPITATLFLVGTFSIAGTPLFNCYASKSIIYTASAGLPIYLTVAIIVDVLTMVFFLRVFRMVFLGKKPKRLLNVKEAPRLALLPMCILAALCIVIGVLPRLGLSIVGPAQEAVTNPGNYIGGMLGGA
jgi:formate hydrogenlyase subunit 3/multisubunit Na+/H+ antiporter MnhD subunit